METLIAALIILAGVGLMVVFFEFYTRRIKQTFYENHYLHRLINEYEKDELEFYKDDFGEWRWKKTAVNGEIVGASTEGYKNKSDCIKNAERNLFVKAVHKSNL